MIKGIYKKYLTKGERMENVIYENGNVYVDTTKYRVDNKTYPINGIASVEMGRNNYEDVYDYTETIPAKHGWTWAMYIVLPLLGIFIAWTSSHGFSNTIVALFWWIVGALITAAVLHGFLFEDSKSIDYYKPVPPDYTVKISTSAGDTDSYVSKDQDLISEIVDAITTAITKRG